MTLLRNIKKTLHAVKSHKHIHGALRMEFTLTTLPPDVRSQVASIVNDNPLESHISTKTEKERELDIIYIAHGIVELKGDIERATKIYDREGAGESNKLLLEALKKLTPSQDERVKDLFIVMAFSPEEIRLIDAVMDVDARKELARYLSDKEDLIEAINFCKEFFMALGTAHMIAEEHKITTETAMLMLSKSILVERNLLPPDKIAEIPDMPSEKVQVNVKQPQ